MPRGAGLGAAPNWRQADWTLARIAEAVSIVGPDGRLLYLNPAATAILEGLGPRPEGRAVDGVLRGAVDSEGAPIADDRLPSEITRLTGVECTDVEIGVPDAQAELVWLRISTRRLSDGEAPFHVVSSFVDVTESRRIAGELRRTEDRYRTVVESLHEGVVIQGPDGRVVASNQRAREILGLTEDELSGSSAFDPRWRAVHPDGSPWTARDHPSARVLTTGEPQVGTVMGVDQLDGGLRWVVVNAVPIRDDAAAVAGVVVSFVDVTERHEVEAALARSEEGFRLLAEHSGDVVARMDMDSRFLYVSPAAERIYGWRPEDMLGRSALEFIHPDDAPRRHDEHRELLAGRDVATSEFRMLRPDGGWRWVEGTMVLVRGTDGSPEGLQSTTRDISRRRAQDEALRRATEQFSSAFSHAPIGMCLVGTDGRFMRVNRSLCELVGYAEDDLLALTFQDITHPDDLDADLALLQEVLSGTRTSYTMEKRYIHADGREIWVLLAVSIVHDDAGAPLHFISQIQDITERRHLEARLREQAERDPLTGLFNRRRFEEEMHRQITRTARTGEPSMLAVIDLDHFKRVNDAEGHLAGDNLLRAVSEALAGRLRLTDVLVRMGGDEFAAILVGADEAGGAAIGRMLVSAVRDVGGEGRTVTASVGLARIEADDDPAGVLARADAAMYAAKAAGRGVVRLGAEPE